MAEKTRSETSEEMASFGFDTMMQMQRPTFTAMAELNGRLYESFAAVNKEWTSFVNRRLKEDLAVPQQLAECKTVQDFYRVYAQFFQNAYADYQAELEQMTKLGRSIAETALQPLPSRAEEASRTKH
ncbi:MAG: phasin family protein [Hyphomicrobiaceae bacterium]|nr:MAG: phasin family protein [Hyphomicrobiaceae bacterium]